MNWSSWSEFFSMGGYGVYVWGSYFVTFVCVIGEVLLISRRKRTLIKSYGLIHDSDKETYSVQGEELNIEQKTSSEQEISDIKEISNKKEIKNETTS